MVVAAAFPAELAAGAENIAPAAGQTTPPTALSELAKHSVIVADTGDWAELAAYNPRDVTTNPTLIYNQLCTILKAKQGAENNVGSSGSRAPAVMALTETLQKTLHDVKTALNRTTAARSAADTLAVATGVALLAQVRGRVSTEVPARLSFDKAATIVHAQKLCEQYANAGIGRERILIKLAATWEGFAAAEQLERVGIHTNLTLLFTFAQAQRAADAGVTLISPFVGRVTDWYKAHTGKSHYAPAEDPGVLAVRRILAHFKRARYKTEVMGASFRNTGQILALAGCDLLTIAPKLLQELSTQQLAAGERLENTVSALSVAELAALPYALPLSESDFRWALNADAMATEKLSEGIARFHADSLKLEALLMGAE